MSVFEHCTGAYQVENGKVTLVQGCASGPQATDEERMRVLTQLRAHVDELRDALREENLRRTKADIRASVTPDTLIVQIVTNIEENDRVANRLAKRLRDWVSLHQPELVHTHADHKLFVEAVLEQPRRPDDTMGGELPESDLSMIYAQAQLISQLYAQRELLLEHLEATMQEHMPNLRHVAGAMIGAKLLALAGSHRRLAMLPAGTIQLLGAETALFRHIRNPKARPPKHGIIFNHPLLQRAERKGRIARVLADCIAIAARVDYFKGEFIGETLLAKAEAVE